MKAGMLAGIIAIALLQSGCMIHRQTQPEVEGRLIDSAGKPVSGATVVLASHAEKPVTTLSDKEGRFAFPPQHEWAFFLPIGPMDWFYATSLQVNANGKAYEAETGGGVGGPFELEGDVLKVVCRVPDTSGEMACSFGS
ncbi:carboxypeptidase-like regulatory domain-containing protein [Citrobacter sedlakii]|uniref:carboxypeptidase-like regulatory domain-containing protein n=1 Tax=Citrobacter sedlakii TaxID=67826 RepID=UPI0033369582